MTIFPGHIGISSVAPESQFLFSLLVRSVWITWIAAIVLLEYIILAVVMLVGKLRVPTLAAQSAHRYVHCPTIIPVIRIPRTI